MDAKIKKYISSQPAKRHAVLQAIHTIVLEEDTTVLAAIEPMMGKEMIVYKDRGMMKYGLSGVKHYMSLHVLPVYGSAALHAKYQLLLPGASFKKGCINFASAEQLPPDIVRQLIADCSAIDLVRIREDYLRQKKPKDRLKK